HHFDALCSEADRFFHRLLHCTAECDTLLKLLSDLLGLQLSIQLRMLDLKDRDQHVAACLACKIFAELIDLSAFASDDDARTRCVDHDLQSGRGSLDIDMRDAASGKLLLEHALEFQILGEE